MNTYSNYSADTSDIAYRDTTLVETNKFLRVFLSAVFVAAVFIIPAVTAINFVISPSIAA